MLDLPGIIEGAKDGKGRGRQVIAVARTANLIFIVLDVLKPLGHKQIIEKELEGFGIRFEIKTFLSLGNVVVKGSIKPLRTSFSRRKTKAGSTFRPWCSSLNWIWTWSRRFSRSTEYLMLTSLFGKSIHVGVMKILMDFFLDATPLRMNLLTLLKGTVPTFLVFTFSTRSTRLVLRSSTSSVRSLTRSQYLPITSGITMVSLLL